MTSKNALSAFVLTLVLLQTQCLRTTNGFDPARNEIALIGWILGYQSLRLSLPACGFLTPAVRVANSQDLNFLQETTLSSDNFDYSNALQHMGGCTPATLTNAGLTTETYSLVYQPERTVQRRTAQGSGKVLSASYNPEGRLLYVSDNSACGVSGSIDRTYAYDSLNRVLTEATIQDTSCPWQADGFVYEYAGLGRLPVRSAYTDDTGLYSDALLSYEYQGDLLVGIYYSCIGGSSCQDAQYQFVYNALGQMVQENRILPSAATDTFTYDAEGRIATATTSSATVTYTYNAAGQLASVVETAVQPITVSFTY
jgi:YD repeat-containing protein